MEDYGLAVYQDPELLAQLKTSIPVGGFDAMDNGSTTQNWLRDHGVIPCNFPNDFRHKSTLAVVSPIEYGNVAPFELPDWIQEAMRLAGH